MALSYEDAGRRARRPAHRIMNRLLRRLRGVVGIGLTWGVGWALFGALLTLILRVLRPEDVDPGENELVAAAVFGMAGFLCGAAFGLLLAVAERRRAVADLSVPRAAVWGAVGAAAMPLLTAMPDGMAILFAPLGGVFAAGAVALAKQAARRDALAERTR
jgi:hypothetical protein